MADWREQLMRALQSGNADYMKAMLANVPKETLQQAIPAVAGLAAACAAKDDLDQALVYFDQLVDIDAANAHWYAERAALQLRRGEFAAALSDAQQASALDPAQSRGLILQGDALAASGERERALAAYAAATALAPADEALARKISALSAQAAPALPDVVFDPAILSQSGEHGAAPASMVEGLIRHLSRYGYQQSVRNVIDRVSDPGWLQRWQAALADCAGASLLFHGSELGVLPLLALQAGAAKVVIFSETPLEARIASGIVQKARLAQWRDVVGDRFAAMSQEEKQASFEAFNRDIVFAHGDSPAGADCEWVLFAPLDHTLLGSGVVPALRRWREAGLAPTRILPRRAKLYAQSIEWLYPGSAYRLDPVREFRWSLYPEMLDLSADSWRPLTAAVCVAELDLWQFDESIAPLQLTATADGSVDAIVYWYTLDLGSTSIDSGAEGGLTCLRPAVQYLDAQSVAAGEHLPLDLHVEATRLRFEPRPPRSRPRAARLPSWYVPMMLDGVRNDAYRAALGQLKSDDLVLEIGAGCGLLSMMAADAGSNAVYGCEVNRHIGSAANRIVADNGYAGRVHVIDKDCRRLAMGEDLPRKADVVLFELFDCGLIGEGILHFLAYAREHLVGPDARYVPCGARLRAMLIESRLDRAAGVDVNLLNPFCFTPSYMNVDASRLRYRALSEPFDLFSFDFATATPEPQEVRILSAATSAGTAGAVLFWFDLQMDEQRWLSNAPQAQPSYHWHQGMQYLPEIQVESGMPLPLTAKHQGSGLSFAWRDAEIPQRAFSRLPRVDPSSWAQSMELEAQTQQLLQHCRSNPEEYARVAELAMRIAIDPARYGVDAKVAQRFAGMFI